MTVHHSLSVGCDNNGDEKVGGLGSCTRVSLPTSEPSAAVQKPKVEGKYFPQRFAVHALSTKALTVISEAVDFRVSTWPFELAKVHLMMVINCHRSLPYAGRTPSTIRPAGTPEDGPQTRPSSTTAKRPQFVNVRRRRCATKWDDRKEAGFLRGSPATAAEGICRSEDLWGSSRMLLPHAILLRLDTLPDASVSSS